MVLASLRIILRPSGHLRANTSETRHALYLSALPSTLIESELFGHRRGWLELCLPLGSIFPPLLS